MFINYFNNNFAYVTAIKKCRWGIDNLMTPRHKERWSREVEIMQRLSHPNVVRAISVPDDLKAVPSELPLLCMEYCSKGDLRQVFKCILKLNVMFDSISQENGYK